MRHHADEDNLMADRKATGNAEVIGDIVARVLQRAGLEQSLENNRILKLWASAVGPAVSRHASPRALHRGKLTVTVDSSSWHAELERYFKTGSGHAFWHKRFAS